MRRLMVRPGAIGDCLLALPAMRHLRASYTEVWVPSCVAPLVLWADRVRSIASTGIDLVGLGRDLDPALRDRLQSFDQIVSWYGSNRPEFRSALQSVGVECVFHRALPDERCTLHAADYFSAQVSAPAGLAPSISVPEVGPRNTIVIHPFSGSRRKNWPLDRYRELAAQLPLPVEWSAGPEEPLEGANRFESLFALARWISGAALYIGNDSGITHLAAAVGVPVLAIFGPSDSRKWAPRGRSVRICEGGDLEELQIATIRKLAEEGLADSRLARRPNVVFQKRI